MNITWGSDDNKPNVSVASKSVKINTLHELDATIDETAIEVGRLVQENTNTQCGEARVLLDIGLKTVVLIIKEENDQRQYEIHDSETVQTFLTSDTVVSFISSMIT